MRRLLVHATFALTALAGVSLLTACTVAGGEPTDPSSAALTAVHHPLPDLELAVRPTPWLVLLCKPNDDASEPKPRSFFEDLYTAKGTGKGGAADFFAQQSYGAISLAGSEVWPRSGSWYTVPQTRAALDAGFNSTRLARAQACVNAAIAAEDKALSMKKYFGIIAVYNAALDSGMGGWGDVTDALGVTKGHPLIVAAEASRAYAVAFNTHEMLHGYGLAHAHDDRGHDYGDDWSIMGTGAKSFLGPFGRPDTCVGPYSPLHPCESGPGMTAFERDAVGWMPAERVYTWGRVSTPGSGWVSETVDLAPVNEPGTPGTLHLKVPIDSPDHYYSVDFKKKSGWDRNVDGNAVAVREIIGGQSYLQTLQGDRGTFLPGQYFSDYGANIRISVLGFDAAMNTATVNVRLDHVKTGPPKHRPGEHVPSLPF